MTYHWCTSTSTGRWRQFVASRLTEIQASSSPKQWFHTPGSDKVADLATRGISAEELGRRADWWTGPEWLSWDESSRPAAQPGRADSLVTECVQSEMRSVTNSAIVAAGGCRPIVNIKHYSSLKRAIGVVNVVFKCIRLTCKQPVVDAATARDEALNHLILCTQRAHFPQEVELTASGEPVPRRSKLAFKACVSLLYRRSPSSLARIFYGCSDGLFNLVHRSSGLCREVLGDLKSFRNGNEKRGKLGFFF